MSSEYRIKLRKQYNLVEEPDLLFEKFSRSLGPNSNPVIGRIVKPNIFLQIDETVRHYWSPEMTITMEKEDDKTRIHEVIGPNSSVFTLTMFMIFFAGTLFLFTLMFLFSQLTLNMDTSFTWVIIGVCFLLFLIISLFMFIGRIKAKPQTELLRQFVEEVLN